MDSFMMLVLLVVLVKGQYTEFHYLWESTYIEKSNWDNNDFEKDLMSTTSKTICGSQAKNQLKPMFCIYDSKCVLTTYQEQPLVSSNGMNNPVRCWTTPTEGGCKLSPGVIKENGEEFSYFCDTGTCTDGTIIPEVPPSSESKPACPNDWTMDETIGCVKFFSSKLTWCEARKNCLNNGGDLVKTDTVQSLESLRLFVDQYEEDVETWVGIYRVHTDWKFTNGGEILSTSNGVWGNGEPNGASTSHYCARLKNKRLYDKLCNANSNKHSYVCQILVQ